MTYDELVQQTDTLCARLQARYAPHLQCRAGCSSCCHHHLSVFPVEAARVQQAVAALPPAVQRQLTDQARSVNEAEARGEAVACPLLLNDQCSIYAARPLICRTQGLPLLLEVETNEYEVDFCPLNFAAENATDELDEQHLVPLDELNLQLALANLEFCRTEGVPVEQSGERQMMSALILSDTPSQ